MDRFQFSKSNYFLSCLITFFWNWQLQTVQHAFNRLIKSYHTFLSVEKSWPINLLPFLGLFIAQFFQCTGLPLKRLHMSCSGIADLRPLENCSMRQSMYELHNNDRSAIYSLPMNEQTFRMSTLWA